MFRWRLSVLHILATAGCLYPGAPASDFQMLFEKGRACEQAADWACAEASYRACLELQPAAAEALSNLGVVLAHQGKFEAAIAAYVRTLRLRPSLTPVRVNLGLAYSKTGRLAAAIREFRLYLAKDPGNRQTRQLLATALLESDQYAEAAGNVQIAFAGWRSQHSPWPCNRLRAPEAGGRIRAPARRLPRRPEFGGLAPRVGASLSCGQRFRAVGGGLSRRAAIGALARRRSLRTRGRAVGSSRTRRAPSRSGEQSSTLIQPILRPSSLWARRLLSKGTLPRPGRCWSVRGPCVQGTRPRFTTSPGSTGRSIAGALELLEKSVRLDPKNRQARYLLAQVYRAQGRDADAAREFDMVRRLSAQDLGRDEDVLRGR